MPRKSLPSRDLLVIDTTLPEGFLVALARPRGGVVARVKVRTQYGHGERLLPVIVRLLVAKKITPQRLKGIIVVSGPGRFSAVRAGVVVANALAIAAGIPVVGVPAGSLQAVAVMGAKLLAKAGRKLVIPAYGQAPSITIKKSPLITT